MIPCGECRYAVRPTGTSARRTWSTSVPAPARRHLRIRDARGEVVITAISSQASATPSCPRRASSPSAGPAVEWAALAACCVHRLSSVNNVAKVRPGEAVAIWGLGVGLNILRSARLRQANPHAIDLEGERGARARAGGDPLHLQRGHRSDTAHPGDHRHRGGRSVRGHRGSRAVAQPGGRWATGAASPASGSWGRGGVQLPLQPDVPRRESPVASSALSTHDDIPMLADMAMSGS
jgi:hypothetical protein